MGIKASCAEKDVCNSAHFDPVEYINTPRWLTSKPGLRRIEALAEKLGRPQDRLRFVHVAGTNGKGSVCAYLSSILQESGLKVGLFTSPYIERFEERIRVDSKDISTPDLTAATLRVRDAACAVEAELGEHPTEFELMCAVALVHFEAVGCDICVMETGLGGRLDATNIITPDISVITRIGLDHTDLLGETLDEIASEKAGIIKSGCSVVSWQQDAEALIPIEAACKNRGCQLIMPDFNDLKVCALNFSSGLYSFEYKGKSYQIRLLGSCQPFNASVAIEAAWALRALGWNISDNAIYAGLENTRWTGRFEIISKEPLCIVDGAHNPQGAYALAESLRELLAAADMKNCKVNFIAGVLADKDYEHMIAALVPLASSFTTYTPDNPRALTSGELASAIHAQAQDDILIEAAESPEAAVKMALSRTSSHDCVVAFGTLYSVSRIKKCLQSVVSAGIS
ncbi:folylpolyglutamate synthase/dihydrofolate synthase family protein [Adlercreutzia sp. ZJ304]|uniref:bifunctional folylpolyglutamate synthase/dihydrofolate synthase n=1 Tax=Adlercreutzia sp. ZJ304 TaxID=2709791 RepID=UPI0013EAAE7C|nr:folylpolyglutamate synthase/dihydrofolate synthase family protein [Adlercreutzia sp. ZJ304]